MVEHDVDQVFEGVDWRGGANLPAIRPRASIRFADLRDCTFAGLELTEVEFIGGRLNGAAFTGSRLQGARIVGCFAADDLPPVDLRGAAWDGLRVVGSHLHDEGALPPGTEDHWPTEVAVAAAETLSERSDERHRACQTLAKLGDQRPTLILGCLLVDRQWEVRAAALEALGELYKGGFPYANDVLVAWMLRRLGDEHSLVRAAARRLIRLINPPDHVLLQATERMAARQPAARLEGLRTATELVRSDDRFADAIDHGQVERLLDDPSPAIRAEAFHLFGIVDDSRPSVWRRALTDPDPAARVKALEAMRLLSSPVPADLLLPLVRDDDPSVRLETIYTLGQQQRLDRGALAIALDDSSPEVRRAARQLLDRQE
jgi:HEAT repeat protein